MNAGMLGPCVLNLLFGSLLCLVGIRCKGFFEELMQIFMCAFVVIDYFVEFVAFLRWVLACF